MIAAQGTRALVFAALAMLVTPAIASAILVPDDAPTIQAGIDSGADTILVRPGFYPETLRVGRALSLRGLPDPGSSELPEAMGLILDNAHMNAVDWVAVSALHFGGPVQLAFSYQNPMGPFSIAFSDCVMDSGLTDQPLIHWDQFNAYVTGCRIAGGVSLTMPEHVSFENNVVQGPVRLGAFATGLWVVGNTIEGPGVCGIHGTFQDATAHIAGNTVRGFEDGIYLDARHHTEVLDNVIEDCAKTGITIEGLFYSHSVTQNFVRSCGTGYVLGGPEVLWLTRNVAEDCGAGIFVNADNTRLFGNRVSGCQTGLRVDPNSFGGYDPGIVSRGNLVEHCGSGFDLWSYGDCASDRDTVIDCSAGMGLQAQAVAVDSAVVMKCAGPGMMIEGLNVSLTHSVLGHNLYGGASVSATGTFSLSQNTIYLNGASGISISDQGETSGTITNNVVFGNAHYGVTVDVGIALAMSCNDWFGNLSGATQGTAPGATDLAIDPGFCDAQADDVHLAPGSPLVDAPGCGLIGALGAGCPQSPTAGVIESPAPRGFALARVGPVPAKGPIALELVLPRAAVIDVSVHDVQGRTVARLAGGEWSAGRHAIEWNGEGARGRVPPGLYLIRYRFPGGQDSRRVVIYR